MPDWKSSSSVTASDPDQLSVHPETVGSQTPSAMTAPLVLTSMSANDTDVLVACDDETASSGVATQPRTVHANTLQLVALVTVATILAPARAGDAVEKFHVAG